MYNLILSNSVFPAGEKKIRRRILDLGKILRIRRVLWNYRLFPVTLMMLAFNGPCTGFRRRYMGNILDLHADPKWIVKAYCELGVLYRNDFAHSFFCRVLKCVSHATGRRLSFHF